MRVVSMRMNVPRFGCPLGRRRGLAEDEMSRSVQQDPCAYIGQILDRVDPNHHNLLKSLASRTRFELVLPP